MRSEQLEKLMNEFKEYDWVNDNEKVFHENTVYEMLLHLQNRIKIETYNYWRDQTEILKRKIQSMELDRKETFKMAREIVQHGSHKGQYVYTESEILEK